MIETLDRLRVLVADRYAVERELGRGGMATVYLATDVRHDRRVAIKVLLPDLAATIGAERFEREIKLAARLQHPNILGLFDSGHAEDLLYYVMPFIDGESVRDRLDREKQLPVEDAVRIALEVADALGYAHAQGIIHRDIKPENVMLSNGHALVADFGIARARTEAGQNKLTQTGMAMGTPVYMSPEQFTGEEVGPTADIYSLGCMLFEMLAGEPPFTGKNSTAIMAKHAMEAVPSIRHARRSRGSDPRGDGEVAGRSSAHRRGVLRDARHSHGRDVDATRGDANDHAAACAKRGAAYRSSAQTTLAHAVDAGGCGARALRRCIRRVSEPLPWRSGQHRSARPQSRGALLQRGGW
ncbi:serine/threonine-protein kinase [Gemmatimonas sp.]|uniref:serine/threonine-protein kinase n=1 Tax=Gemmatimonas sp. TaxID=1962908 RepID=UPI00356715C9